MISIIIPTRERAAYLRHALASCLAVPIPDAEILVLDNASEDDTGAVVSALRDPRIRYLRNDRRLSMRDNFEKAIDASRGEILLTIGDDDAVLPRALPEALEMLQDPVIQAVACERAHYYWPDYASGLGGMALVPRGRGHRVLDSRAMLRGVLEDANYYRLPCVYHGIVRRSLIERVQREQGRLFLSSQVDMYSAIALSMQGVSYALCAFPFIVNGSSSRSNGAAHFGGGAAREKELWKQEDEVGFLPGFADCRTIGALIVESALRYAAAHPPLQIDGILDPESMRTALGKEARLRLDEGRDASDALAPFRAAGLDPAEPTTTKRSPDSRVRRAIGRFDAFLRARPMDLASRGIVDVQGAARAIEDPALQRFSASGAIAQLGAALRMARVRSQSPASSRRAT